MTTQKCTNGGCTATYTENHETACQYHSGTPVFQDTAKSWSCCSKKAYNFDNFLKIPGCQIGKHSSDIPKQIAPKTSAPASTKVANGKEYYGKSPENPTPPAAVSAKAPEKPKIIESDLCDPPDSVFTDGAKCLRPSCRETYPAAQQICRFHNGEPVFHEGTKFWSCCPSNGRVLEFEEFLKINTCQSGIHRFIDNSVEICRHDWYQSQSQVIISIFAKKTNKDLSNVVIKANSLRVDIVFEDGRKGLFETALCQTVDVEGSKYTRLGTKIEVVLKKTNGISWPTLDPCEGVTSWTTFGAEGGMGTVGSKEAMIASDSPVGMLRK